jgi:hypothetical protein
MWVIEKTVKKGKYLYAVVPDHPHASKRGYVLHHRVVVENALGRLLLRTEIVHHKNHQSHDNRIENLEVMALGAHTRLHFYKGDVATLTCANCGVTFTRARRNRPEAKGYKRAFCSRSCVRSRSSADRIGGF